MILGALAIALFGLAWLRLARHLRDPVRERSRAGARRAGLRRRQAPGPRWPPNSDASSTTVASSASLSLAPILYGLLYPQPYLGQLLRGIPIAVVDQDHTELSRDLVQTLNADEAITVAVRADTLADAHAALARRRGLRDRRHSARTPNGRF